MAEKAMGTKILLTRRQKLYVERKNVMLGQHCLATCENYFDA
jgi:hypothetical protein